MTQIITQVVEKIVHVPTKETVNPNNNFTMDQNSKQSDETKRQQKDQKPKVKNNERKLYKPLPKQPSPELTKSLEEPSRMNRDLNSVSRHDHSKLSDANNPFNGPLPS